MQAEPRDGKSTRMAKRARHAQSSERQTGNTGKLVVTHEHERTGETRTPSKGIWACMVRCKRTGRHRN